jgi:RecA-family ATPase
MMSGDGGTGKSYLAHQLLVARALGREWIGLLPTPGKTLYLSCEDNLQEMKRRQYGILKFYGASWKDIRKGDVQLIDLVGGDSILALLRKGVIEPAPMYHALDAFMAKFVPGLTVLDVLAAVFAGNEVVRTEVRQFANLLNGLCKKHKSAILLLAHPSLSGMNTGTGLSGSTDWNNGFRCRTRFSTP